MMSPYKRKILDELKNIINSHFDRMKDIFGNASPDQYYIGYICMKLLDRDIALPQSLHNSIVFYHTFSSLNDDDDAKGTTSQLLQKKWFKDYMNKYKYYDFLIEPDQEGDK